MMGKTYKDMKDMKNQKPKEIDFCLSCMLVARQTGVYRDCSTCELIKESGGPKK